MIGIRDKDRPGLATDIVGEAALASGGTTLPPTAALLLSSMSFLCSSLSSKLRWREAASIGVVGEGSPMMGESWEAGDEVEADVDAVVAGCMTLLLVVLVPILSLCLVIADFADADDGPTERDVRL